MWLSHSLESPKGVRVLWGAQCCSLAAQPAKLGPQQQGANKDAEKAGQNQVQGSNQHQTQVSGHQASLEQQDI